MHIFSRIRQRSSSITGMGREAAAARAELHRRRTAEQHHGHRRQGRRSSPPGQGDRDPGAQGSSRRTSSTGLWQQVLGVRGSRGRRSLAAEAVAEQFMDGASRASPGAAAAAANHAAGWRLPLAGRWRRAEGPVRHNFASTRRQCNCAIPAWAGEKRTNAFSSTATRSVRNNS